MIVFPDSRACLSWREVVSIFSTTPSVCSNWRMVVWSWRSRMRRSVTTTIESKTRLSSMVMEGRQPVGEPGDGEALAAAGRMLDEVALAGAVLAGMGDQPPHGIELLIAGEDQGSLSGFAARSSSSSISWMNWRMRSRTLSRDQIFSQR